MALRFVVLACLLAAHTNADFTLKQLEDSITFDANKYGSVVFNLIEDPKDADKHIKMEDLKDDYYLGELTEIASKKFLKLIDTCDDDEWVDEKEMGKYFEKPQVKLALYECIPIKSDTLENLCLRDQLLSYVLLVLDDLPKGAANDFFDHIEDPSDQDQVIKKEDLAKKGITDTTTQENMMRELTAGEGGDVDRAEFIKYITNEDVGPHFRECKIPKATDKDTGLFDYTEDCLLKELADFVDHHLTELDMAGIFNWLDSGDDKFVTGAEIDSVCGSKPGSGDYLISLMDDNNDKKLHYGEFRALFRQSNHYRKVLTKDCDAAVQKVQEGCYQKNFKTFAESRPHPKLLHLPDLDVIFIFEHLDSNDDGKIAGVGKLWSDQTAMTNLIKEADGSDQDTDVDLDEFMGYTKKQNFVYGIGDCMSINEGQKRLECYDEQYMAMMGHMLLKADVDKFFDWYEDDADSDKDITINDLKKKCTGLSEARMKYYLLELGMGDEVVTFLEFDWFVTQEELLILFKGHHGDLEAMHHILIQYIEEHMTEYDIQELFLDLDAHSKNLELTVEDLKNDEDTKGKDDAQYAALIKAMDTKVLLGLPEPDNTVNFYEFWLFFVTPINANRRDKHFDKCAKDNSEQDKEIDCYKQKLFDNTIY